jgi:hypothetical protein
MAAVMVFADCRFSESQPIFDFVPFVVGIAKPKGSVTTRTLYGQLVFEVIGYSGFAVNNFGEGYWHFYMLVFRFKVLDAQRFLEDSRILRFDFLLR